MHESMSYCTYTSNGKYYTLVLCSNSMKTHPGRVIAESNARNQFVAIKNTDCLFLRKSLIAVSIDVVNIRDSIDRSGFSRFK